MQLFYIDPAKLDSRCSSRAEEEEDYLHLPVDSLGNLFLAFLEIFGRGVCNTYRAMDQGMAATNLARWSPIHRANLGRRDRADRERLRRRFIARELHDGFQREGCRFDPSTCKHVKEGAPYYVVSIREFGASFADFPDLGQVQKYVDETLPIIDADPRRLYLDAWRDTETGKHYLDVNAYFYTEAAALEWKDAA